MRDDEDQDQTPSRGDDSSIESTHESVDNTRDGSNTDAPSSTQDEEQHPSDTETLAEGEAELSSSPPDVQGAFQELDETLKEVGSTPTENLSEDAFEASIESGLSLLDSLDDNNSQQKRTDQSDSEDVDDLLALAWEKSLSSSSESSVNLDQLLNGGNELEQDLRELDQSEIDSLLGFADPSGSKKALSGIDAILNKTLIYYERLPMMEVVFDRLLRILSTSLRNFTSDNVEISLESMKSTRFGDYLNSIALPAMLGVFHAQEWDNQGLLVVDSALIYSIVDVLLGGRRSITATRVEGRPYTTIERNLIEKLMNVFLEDLRVAFEPVSPITFNFERLEINPHFAMIARAANAGILIKLHIEIDDRGGRMSLMLPYATIEPIRELLLQNFMGEKFGRDSIWEQHLANELWETDVEFDIHLDHTTMPLGKVLHWKPGDQIQFSVTPNSLVSAVSGEHELFKGVVGHKNGKVAIRVEENMIRVPTKKTRNI